jgi:hypothetical protein
MTCRSPLEAVLVSKRTRAAEPDARLFGVWKRGWSGRRAGRTGWPTTPRPVTGSGIAGPPGGAELAEEHREKSHQHNDGWVGESQKVETAMRLIGHQNRVSLPAEPVR